MSFEALQLAPPILKALSRCGHDSPTPVQREAIPIALSGKDLIASANTGTGKTAAFVLPALQKLFDDPSKRGLRILVLSPTRELAEQIARATSKYGRYTKAHSVAIYGGMPFGDQIRALSQSPEMIIATPGRLIDHIWRGRINLSNVEMFILDEADRMLDMGFIEDVEFVADAMPEQCQTLLFAATMNPATTKLAQKFMKDPERVDLALGGKVTHDKIEQRLHITDNLQHKGRILRHLCSGEDLHRAIVFSATKKDADMLARQLGSEGFGVAALHGDMTQTVRNRTMENMRRGKIKILVATDVAARGIDITGVSHVINFDLPRSAEDYVNRIGRTGRASQSGVAISLVSQADFEYLDRIERYIGQNLNIEVIPGLEPTRALSAGKKSRPPSARGKKPPFGRRRNRPAAQGAKPEARGAKARATSPRPKVSGA
ncbi:MAG: DEAD/DEAH box helicase [Syntrophobacteraceae bacterium]